MTGKISTHVGVYAGVAAAVGFVTHLAVRLRARYADPIMVPCVVLINGLGLVMIHRLDLGLKQSARRGSAALLRPVRADADGLDRARRRAVRRPAAGPPRPPLAGPLRLHDRLGRAGVPGHPGRAAGRFSEVNGAKIWIRAFGFSLQPGELAKIALTDLRVGLPGR